MLPRTRGLVVVVAVGFLSAFAAWPAIACVVGTGTSASCSEGALDACLPGSGNFDGAVTFACGGAATITVTSMKTISANTTIDGGSVITISGGGTVTVFGVNSGMTFTVQNLTIVNARDAFGVGGAISGGGNLTVTNSTFSGNSATEGGAIFVSGTATVTNSTFSGNSTFGGAGGGAIGNVGTLTVTNSTFSGNNNSAIVNSGTLTVTNSTFSGNNYGAITNFAGMLTVTNSIVANSSGGINCFGTTISDGGHNIDDGTTCGFTGTGCTNTSGTSFCNTNPLLDAAGLANNGGPTQTIALQGGSPAIDAVPIAQCPSTDQRGAPRPDPGDSGGTACDSGAFESGGVVGGTTTTTSTSTTTTTLSSNACDSTPASGCQPAAGQKAQLLLGDGKLSWKWTSSATVAASDFGSPPTTTKSLSHK